MEGIVVNDGMVKLHWKDRRGEIRDQIIQARA